MLGERAHSILKVLFKNSVLIPFFFFCRIKPYILQANSQKFTLSPVKTYINKFLSLGSDLSSVFFTKYNSGTATTFSIHGLNRSVCHLRMDISRVSSVDGGPCVTEAPQLVPTLLNSQSHVQVESKFWKDVYQMQSDDSGVFCSSIVIPAAFWNYHY